MESGTAHQAPASACHEVNRSRPWRSRRFGPRSSAVRLTSNRGQEIDVIRQALATLAAFFALATVATAQSPRAWPTTPGDFSLKNFRFHSGETLPELHLHYLTLGAPKRDAAGHVSNAVLILHGTGGTGGQFLVPQFAN